MPEKKKRATQQKSSGATNINDVLIKVVESLYNLLNNGNIFGFIVLAFVLQIFYLTYKMPVDILNVYIINLFTYINSEKYYLLPLGIALSFSVTINIIQPKLYKKEIKRLSEERQELMHGRKTGKLKVLSKHTSSKFDITE